VVIAAGAPHDSRKGCGAAIGVTTVATAAILRQNLSSNSNASLTLRSIQRQLALVNHHVAVLAAVPSSLLVSQDVVVLAEVFNSQGL